jgi:predicted NAD/FAD-dependent oxidoreductase
MTAFEHPLKLSFDGAWVHNSSLSWIARNSSKPQRQQHECWVLHGTSEWSREEFDQDPKWICSHLLSTFFEETEHEILTPSWLSSHRWRYASAASSLSDGSFWDPASRLGICGDWCRGSRVEAAFLSGKGLAEKILVS